ARHDDVRVAGPDGLRGEMDRLLAGPALAVDRRRGNVLGESGREPGHAAGCRGLLADLRHAADDDVIHRARLHLPSAGEESLQSLRQKVDRVYAAEGAAGLAAADRRAYRGHDHRIAWAIRLRVSHGYCLS